MEKDFNKAVDNLKEGNYKTAEKLLKKILSKNPKDTKALNNLALVYKNQQKHIEAVETLKGVLEIDSDNYVAHNNLANIYIVQRKFKLAKRHYLLAIGAKKNYADALGNLGVLLQTTKDFPQAARYYKKALKIDPNHVDHLSNLASILGENGNPKGARAYAEKALIKDSNNASVHNNYANILRDLGELSGAQNHYKKAISLDPRMAEAYANLVELSLKLCSWEDVQKYHTKLKNMGGETPFLAIRLSQDLAYSLKIAKSESDRILGVSQRANLGLDYWLRERRERIRIGYIGNIFKNHPTGRVVMPIFSHHNRNKYEIFAFSYGENDGSDVRAHVEKKVEHFVDIRNLSDAQAAKKINKYKVEILVDLTGHTRGGRMGIMAHHPSPFQISWLGFPGTSGAIYNRYLIADTTIVPESEAKHYSEKLIHTPNCYQINSGNPKVSEKTFNRSEYGISKDAFVFCSLSRATKIDESTFRNWMKILKKVPDSVLVLVFDNDIATKKLYKTAKKLGVDSKRLIFVPRLPHDQHLKRLSLFDLALDPRFYSGGATTADMLFMGLPVITIKGNTYISRMTDSHLIALGMGELITKTENQYAGLAVNLANNTKRLKAVKNKLIKNKKSNTLFNPRAYMAFLEDVYTNIVVGDWESQ